MDEGRTCVLLLEGGGEVAQATRQRLESCGYAVVQVASGEAAVAAVRDATAGIDLILVDAALGNQIAESAAAEILLAPSELPVVSLVSGGEAAGPAPAFLCHGCVAKGGEAPVLDITLKAALRAFSETRAARRRETELEAAAARTQLGFWELDRDGRCFRASDAAHRVFDVSGSLDLETVSELYASQSSELLRALDLAEREGKSFGLVSEIQTPSGQRKWVRTQGQRDDGSGESDRRVRGTVQDISEIRLLDRVALESEQTLNQVEQFTHIGHWSVSLTDGSVYHSDEIKRIFGYEPSEYALSVEQAIEAYHPDDRDEVIRLFNRAVETGEDYEFDLRVVQPSGAIRHVHSKGYAEKDGSGKVTRVYGVFQDVTAQLVAERALRESGASLKALVDAVHTAIVVHGKDGEILLSNQMANRLLAPLVKDLVGRALDDPAWQFVFEDGRDVPASEFPVSQVLATRQPVENLVLGRRDENDQVAWLLVNAVPAFDESGELSSIIVSFVDITKHREMEEQFHQSEKMRVIGQLAGGVAHDFNNQLVVMLNCVELLEETLAEDAREERSWVDAIRSSAMRSAQLTKQLLAFARKGNYVVKVVDVNVLISEVASMVSHSFDKKIRIIHRANVRPAAITGDASQLQNALLNMALNSRDAMPEGGDLEFTTERVVLDRASLESKGLDPRSRDCLRVTIRDTGVGMDAEAQRHVFEPFFTTKQPGQGTGMGMASVYGTVKNHRGAIEVESEPGGGTVFTLYFPFALGDVERSNDAAVSHETNKGRVLIVDDEEGVATSTSMLLAKKGFATRTYSSATASLREFEKSWRDTDVVLLDMIMPEMSGAEAFYAMKAIDPDASVVLTSGYSFTNEAKKLVDDGASAFLVKPVPPGELVETIASVIARRRGSAP